MFIAYIVVTVLAAGMNGYAAYADFSGAEWILDNVRKYGVPDSWLFLLGVLKAAAAFGLLVGIAIPVIGSAAAIGLIAYFIGAIVTTMRARYWTHVGFPVAFLAPAAASLALLLASSMVVTTRI